MQAWVCVSVCACAAEGNLSPAINLMIYGLMFWAMSRRRRRRVCFGCRVCFSNDLRDPREILVEARVALNHLEWSAPRAQVPE